MLVVLALAVIWLLNKVWKNSGGGFAIVRTVTPRARASARLSVVVFAVALYGPIVASFLVLWFVIAVSDNGSVGEVFCSSVWFFGPGVAAAAGRFVPAWLEQRRARTGLSESDGTGVDEAVRGEHARDYFLRVRFDWRRQWATTLVAYLLPAAAGLMTYLLTVTTGATRRINLDFVADKVAPRLHLTPLAPGFQLTVYLFYAVFVGPFWDVTCPAEADFGIATGGVWAGTSWVLLAFVEEVGWSGLLFPAAQRAFAGPGGYWKAVLLTATAWVLFHVPLIVGAGHIPSALVYHPGDEGTTLAWALAGFTMDLFAARYIMCVLQTLDGSIWPCVFFHAAHNMIVASLFSQLMAPNPKWHFDYFVGESGIYQILVYVFIALGLHFWCSDARDSPTFGPPTSPSAMSLTDIGGRDIF